MTDRERLEKLAHAVLHDMKEARDLAREILIPNHDVPIMLALYNSRCGVCRQPVVPDDEISLYAGRSAHLACVLEQLDNDALAEVEAA